MPGPRMTSQRYSFVSLPMAAPTCCTSSVFHVEARQVPMGNAVAWNVWVVPGRVGSMRTPAGPSVSTVAGMPKRGMRGDVPAAPATRSASPPTTAPVPKKLLAPPTNSLAFSSSVIAFSTSSMLSALSLGCAFTVFIVIVAIMPMRINRFAFILSYFYLNNLGTNWFR